MTVVSVYVLNLLSFCAPFLVCLFLLVFCVVYGVAISWWRSNNRRTVQPLLPWASGWLWRNHDREVIIVAPACPIFHQDSFIRAGWPHGWKSWGIWQLSEKSGNWPKVAKFSTKSAYC